MRRTTRLTLTTLVAALLLAAAVTTASARRFTTSSQNIRFTWTTLEFTSGAITIRCPMTLEGNTHRREIEKVVGSLIGAVTAAGISQERCVGGTVAVFNGVERFNGRVTGTTLPWHITYEGFTGVLPNIVTVRLLLARFRVGVSSGLCTDGQYGSATDNLVYAANREARGAITSLLTVEGRTTATKIAGGAFCPATGTLNGSATVEAGPGGARITITLI